MADDDPFCDNFPACHAEGGCEDCDEATDRFNKSVVRRSTILGRPLLKAVGKA